MPKFILKDNQLSEYALSCGYLQQATDSGDKFDYTKKLELSKRFGIYEVFYMNYKEFTSHRLHFKKLTEARNAYKSLLKSHKLKSVKNIVDI